MANIRHDRGRGHDPPPARAFIAACAARAIGVSADVSRATELATSSSLSPACAPSAPEYVPAIIGPLATSGFLLPGARGPTDASRRPTACARSPAAGARGSADVTGSSSRDGPYGRRASYRVRPVDCPRADRSCGGGFTSHPAQPKPLRTTPAIGLSAWPTTLTCPSAPSEARPERSLLLVTGVRYGPPCCWPIGRPAKVMVVLSSFLAAASVVRLDGPTDCGLTNGPPDIRIVCAASR